LSASGESGSGVICMIKGNVQDRSSAEREDGSTVGYLQAITIEISVKWTKFYAGANQPQLGSGSRGPDQGKDIAIRSRTGKFGFRVLFYSMQVEV